MTTEWIIIVVLVLLLLLVLWRQRQAMQTVGEVRAQQLFEQWKAEELPGLRKKAIQTSQSVTLGKSLEHIVPYLPEFAYNPQDVRFLGSPIDLVVFDGLSEGQLREVVFIEIKTGKKVHLPAREKAVKECIQRRAVKWELLHTQSGTSN